MEKKAATRRPKLKESKGSDRKGPQGTVITGMGSNRECGNQINLFILFQPQLPHT